MMNHGCCCPQVRTGLQNKEENACWTEAEGFKIHLNLWGDSVLIHIPLLPHHTALILNTEFHNQTKVFVGNFSVHIICTPQNHYTAMQQIQVPLQTSQPRPKQSHKPCIFMPPRINHIPFLTWLWRRPVSPWPTWTLNSFGKSTSRVGVSASSSSPSSHHRVSLYCCGRARGWHVANVTASPIRI